jgi:hypothetical protein
MGDEYTTEEDLETAEDMELLEENFDELSDDLDGINQLRVNEGE